jgi:hypothetical protein
MKTFFNSPNVEYGPSWPFSHLFSGRVYTNGDEERFVLWHKTPEHIVEVSGKLLPIKGGHFPLIEKIKLGIQAAPRGGVPHWGYTFKWMDPEAEYRPEIYLEIVQNLFYFVNQPTNLDKLRWETYLVSLNEDPRKKKQRWIGYLMEGDPALEEERARNRR